jgi:hypothetical protein
LGCFDNAQPTTCFELKSLNNQGYNIGIYQTATLMKQVNVVAIRPRKRHYYPDAGTRCPVSPRCSMLDLGVCPFISARYCFFQRVIPFSKIN